jgi:hypothetical protein
MTTILAQDVVRLKSEFRKAFRGNSHLHEALPVSCSELLPIEDGILQSIDRFVQANPIYFKSKDVTISGISCRVYEGDINSYWLGSIKHDTSYQPFYPTWMLSAYALAVASKELGFEEIVDIGSGDGRIAYCGELAGMRSFGIEIDSDLVCLQQSIIDRTGVRYQAINADATSFDYASLKLSRPLFFISGLPEMGEMLANSVIRVASADVERAGFVFMGSHMMRKYSRDHTKWGWGQVIDKFGLQVIDTVTLPTHWTTDQESDTPYVFTRSF